ncbi:PQQ-binding-like beta-propeller repeat protein [Paracidobacterium acidisoli]|uniref:Quinoprotein glucose dehydrogenase n=1 Tax=Paracidobacterium acidisoli TaxID=2303751 RepID=A0A372IU30_9BACT|nr:PQQ-binding-like beta-propeller repeat protein [Paracidobacterium acidisoli]MBT9329721.1 PQQ-binding-like beta-propeller repeat protein [Paracidobacterium acidisoli]
MHQFLRTSALRLVTVAGTVVIFAGSLNILQPSAYGRNSAKARAITQQDWPAYNGNQNGDHYSSLAQINRSNIAKLKPAWVFDLKEAGGLQTNPLIIGRTMYAYTTTQTVLALDAVNGKKLWQFVPEQPSRQPARGLSYWTDGRTSILFAGMVSYLYALDPQTGRPISEFGEGGRIDLRKGLADPGVDYTKTFAAMTSPGTIYKDMIIVGFRAPETEPALRGDIRAFDVHTGALRWSFHTIPHPGEPGYSTWMPQSWKTSGSANNWAGMTLDQKRGILYVPTGSAVNDFYGFDRIGDDLYANTLLALDANTGKLIWHFQDVHHDIWDRDFPSPPALITVRSHGRSIDAVAQTSKQGFVFLFDRVTGKPLFSIQERPFPPSVVPGEKTSPTQPIPLAPAPYARQRLTADMLTTRTPEAHAWALDHFRTFVSDGQFVPFRVDKQTVVFPGFDGGAEWGGPGVDPHTGVIYINANDIAWTGGLTENKPGASLGETIYQSQCSVCHGADRQGSPPEFPSLAGVTDRFSNSAIGEILHRGRGRMPSFPNIDGTSEAALLNYLRTGGKETSDSSGHQQAKEVASTLEPLNGEAKYRFTGYRKFLDPDGYPAVRPPWGTLNAIDMNTGHYLWKIPLGSYPELAAAGMKNTGSENYGGPLVTAGGVVMIAATNFDRQIRAFNSSTGELLWSATLPYSGNATPATYMIDGRQYVVIAASGARDTKGPQGAAYVAFALPETDN